jgi:hypothetical protein
MLNSSACGSADKCNHDCFYKGADNLIPLQLDGFRRADAATYR